MNNKRDNSGKGVARYKPRNCNDPHYWDVRQAYAAMSTTGTVFALSNPGQGLTVNGRLGAQVEMKKLIIRLTVYQDTSATPTACRISVVRWNHPGVPTFAEIYDYTASVDAVHSPFNYNSLKYIDVLYDTVKSMNTNYNTEHNIEIVRDSLGTAQWITAAGAPDRGHLYMLIRSDSVANPGTNGFHSRLWFDV